MRNFDDVIFSAREAKSVGNTLVLVRLFTEARGETSESKIVKLGWFDHELPRARISAILLLITACLITSGQPLRAQGVPPDYSTKKLSLEEGLPHREVRSTTLDSNGIMWASTAAGLVRYDGYTFTLTDTPGRLFKGQLMTGPGGLLYCRPTDHPDSLEFFDPYRLRSGGLCFIPREGLYFGGLYQAANQPVYALMGSEILLVAPSVAPGNRALEQSWPSPQSLHLLPSPIEQGDELIFANASRYLIHRRKANELLYLRDGEVATIRLPRAGSPRKIHHRSDGAIFCATGSGLYYLRPGRNDSKWETYPGVPRRRLNAIYEDAHNHLLVGYKQPFRLRFRSMYLLDQDSVINLSWIPPIEDRIISARGDDFREAITFGTYGGIQQFNFRGAKQDKFTRHLYRPEVGKSRFGLVVRGFTADEFGNVYTNKDSRNSQWYRVRSDRVNMDTLTIRDERGEEVEQYGCCQNMVTVGGHVYGQSCHQSRDSVRAHIYRFTPATDTWKQYHFPLEGHLIRYLLPDTARGVLWVATEKNRGSGPGLLYQFDYERGTFRPVKMSGPVAGFRDYPRKMVLFPPGGDSGPEGSLYIGGIGGLYHFDIATGVLKDFTLPDKEPIRVLEVISYSDSTLLIGTQGMGIYEFNHSSKAFKWKAGKIPRGAVERSAEFIILPSDDIAGIALTREGYLLVTTFNGLVLHHDGQTSVFTTEDGLTNNEFNTTALHYEEETDEWFAGGVNGFVSFHIKDLLPTPSHYTPILLDYTGLDESVGRETSYALPPRPSEPLIISPDVAYFTLGFTLPDFTVGGAPAYETQLVGYDPDWRAPVAAPEVRYTRLPAGEYEFRMRAIDVSGGVTDEIPPLTIKVLKPWYRRAWFHLTASLLIIGLIALAIRLRFNRLRSKLETQRQMHKLEMRTLRQQMNPHFISNAMNAIREFIYNEDPNRAAGYLTDFTRLMRLYLEASRNPTTSIRDEVDLLSHYVRLEQLRFPNKFDFCVRVDDEIDPEMDEVPSFVLQPIVENAINHGLLPLDDGGLLTISFQLSDDEETLTCEVTDNGIGMVAAAGKTRAPGHTSRAGQILQDRRSMMAANSDYTFDVEVCELAPGSVRPGTKVTVTLSTDSPT